MSVITDRDMRDQVTAALGSDVRDFDVPALVDDLIDRWGVCDIDDIPAEPFWRVVAEHDVS